MKTAVVLTFILITTSPISCVRTEELPEIILNEVQNLEISAKIPHSLTQAVNDLLKIKNKKASDDAFCQTCNLVIGEIISYRKSGANKESMITFIRKLCHSFTDWGPVACQGYIDIEIDTVLYIIDNKKDLTSQRVCAISFQAKGCKDPQENKWSIDISRHKTSSHLTHRHNSASPLKILHLTDFHYDPSYKPGNNAKCDVPLCCEESNGPPAKPQDAAGYWGDYRVCDMPWHSVTDFMKYVTTYHRHFDFVYYTGDIISHKSWATSKDHNVQAIVDLFQLFKETFNATPVYPILGNHEPHPTDFYSPGTVTGPKISTQWVFDLVATEWGRWLPDSTKETIRRGGYYTVLIRPGFRIVALNSNVCFTSNLWLMYDDDDPYDQLKWLVDVLLQAEKNGEKVHILSHIPPGEILCLQQWSYQFRRIVNRFAPIISAHFNGHTHLDELRLFYDLNDANKIINVAFNAGSFTTYVGLNPNYRVYDLDQNNYSVLDYDHYTYNLTQANLNPAQSPEWYKLYSFKEAYGLRDTTYDSLEDLVKRMSQNHTLVQDYFRYQVRDSDVQTSKGCDESCLLQILCSITSVEATSSVQCQQLKKKSPK
ncbi:sphingomyelin phosphodiesterase-like [Asbolus verrucosus]|uniref:Sphingomyelin phosphodiesterase n=1 Tax=Asbolus verrucosus TaxID=1661398 RepID=A0A482WCH7_ASBVE|nr:sphingomyelin phosphodiesterase-like [Asbolus verrucosus]